MSEAPKKSCCDSPQQVQYVMAQPIPNGYTVQGITAPYDGRQVMYNDDVMLEVMPVQKTKVIIANQAGTHSYSLHLRFSSTILLHKL